MTTIDIFSDELIKKMLDSQNSLNTTSSNSFNLIDTNKINKMLMFVLEDTIKYIKEHFIFISFIILILLLLYYRYEWYKTNKKKEDDPVFIIHEVTQNTKIPESEYTRIPNYDVNRDIRKMLSR